MALTPRLRSVDDKECLTRAKLINFFNRERQSNQGLSPQDLTTICIMVHDLFYNRKISAGK
jgi:hypothetical protein